MFVTPAQIGQVLKRHPTVQRARLVVDFDATKNDRMTLNCETAAAGDATLTAALVTSLREVCKLRGEVTLVAPGSLPNDGKVIEDTRKYE
jgi:phenylacetate-CoA ligase